MLEIDCGAVFQQSFDRFTEKWGGGGGMRKRGMGLREKERERVSKI